MSWVLSNLAWRIVTRGPVACAMVCGPSMLTHAGRGGRSSETTPPRTAASLPQPAGRCNRRSRASGAHGAVDTEAVALGERVTGAKMLLDQGGIPEERVGYQAQLATADQVLGRALDQRLAGPVAGVHALVERRVTDDRRQVSWRGVDAIPGHHFSFASVRGGRPAAALDGEGVHLQQQPLALRIATLDRGAQHAGPTAHDQYP